MEKNTKTYRIAVTRLTLALSLLFGFIVLTPCQAQIEWGVKGGMQVVGLKHNMSLLNKSNRMGFFVGPTLFIDTGLTPLSFDVAALYDQRNLEFLDHKYTQRSIVIPAHARIGASILDDQLGVFLLAGPQFSMNIGRSMQQWQTDQGENQQLVIQENTVCLDLGVAVRINRLEGSIVYNLPIGNKIADFTWEDVKQKLQNEQWNHTRSRANTWRLALTYYF